MLPFHSLLLVIRRQLDYKARNGEFNGTAQTAQVVVMDFGMVVGMLLIVAAILAPCGLLFGSPTISDEGDWISVWSR